MTFRTKAFLIAMMISAVSADSAPLSCTSTSSNDCMYLYFATTCAPNTGCEIPGGTAACDSVNIAGSAYMLTDEESRRYCTINCNSNADCGNDPYRTSQYCFSSADSSYCAECQTADDCNAIGFVNHECDVSIGFCVYPSALGSCWSNPYFCGNTNGDCYDDGRRCWTPCNSQSDCQGTQTCLPFQTFLSDQGNNYNGICVGVIYPPPTISFNCSSSSDCVNATSPVCSPDKICVPCSSDTDCSHLTGAPHCINPYPRCQACDPTDTTGSNGCGASQQYCITNSTTLLYQCAECDGTDGCSTDRPVCETSAFSCINCSNNDDCSSFGTLPFCDNNLGSCEICSTANNEGCISPQPICITNSGSNICVECTDDSNCGSSRPACSLSSNTCVQCTQNSDCVSALPACLLTNNSCVQCTQNSDCPSALPLCSLSNHSCTISSYETVDATLSIGSSPKQLIVTFDTDISAIANNPQLLQLEIQNLVSPKDFNYTWALSGTNKLIIDITYGEIEIQGNQAQVLFNSSLISNYVKAANSSSGVTLPPFVAVSNSSLTFAQTYSTAVQISGAVVISGTLPSFFTTGTVGSLWNFISLCQIVNYLLYLDVTWPENAQIVFNLFEKASLTFIPNPFDDLIEKLEDLGNVVQAPAIFADNGVSGLFLQNSGSMVFVWGIAAIIYVLTKICKYIWRNKASKIAKLVDHFHKNFEWGVVLNTISGSYVALCLSSALQLASTSFDNWIVGLSTVLALLFGYFLLVFPFICWWILYHRPARRNQAYEKKFGALFEEYKKERSYQRNFLLINLARKITFIGVIVGLSSNGTVQVSLICVNSVLFVAAIVFLRPYEERKNMIGSLGSEILVLGLVICALILLGDKTANSLSYNDKVAIGWAVVALCGMLVGLNAIIMLRDTFFAYKELYNKVRTYFNPKKNVRSAHVKRERVSNSNRMLGNSANVSNTSGINISDSRSHKTGYPQQKQRQSSSRKRIDLSQESSVGTKLSRTKTIIDENSPQALRPSRRGHDLEMKNPNKARENDRKERDRKERDRKERDREEQGRPRKETRIPESDQEKNRKNESRIYKPRLVNKDLRERNYSNSSRERKKEDFNTWRLPKD